MLRTLFLQPYNRAGEDALPSCGLSANYRSCGWFGQDAAEGEAVEAAGAVGAEGGEVGGGAVAFVAGEAVLRKLQVICLHQAVAIGFGDDAGGGDRCRDRVALDDGSLRQRALLEVESVDEQEIGCGLEGRNGEQHCPFGGLEDVNAVDLVRLDLADGVGEAITF